MSGPPSQCWSKQRDPSLRSGFRLQAPASLTPAKRLNIDGWSDSVIEYVRAAEPVLE
jgi:hypothetical protein